MPTGNLPTPPGTLQQEDRWAATRESARPNLTEETVKMLWTITVILFILWIIGLVSSYTFGGWINILLVLAIIVLIFNLLSGRRVV